MNYKVKVSNNVANSDGAQIGASMRIIDFILLEPKDIAASSIELGILSILFFKLITASGNTYNVCPSSTSQSAGSIPTDTI